MCEKVKITEKFSKIAAKAKKSVFIVIIFILDRDSPVPFLTEKTRNFISLQEQFDFLI